MFPLGTDKFGRDLLSRLLHGARTSLSVGIAANFLAAVIGIVVGSVAAFAGSPRLRLPLGGGRAAEIALPVETILMRTTDVVLSLPALLLAIALAAVAGHSLLLVLFVIAGILWTSMARVVYGRVRSAKEADFVAAARAVGVAPGRILWRHILPHIASVIVVYATLGIASTVLFEAVLSYLGVGVPPPAPSWGSMIAEHVSYYRSDPRLLLLPGLAIMVTILAFNLLGDALRDALDPHHWHEG